MPAPYLRLEQLVELLPEPNRAAAVRLLDENEGRFALAPGSRSSHQAWPGGYLGHLEDAMNLALLLYDQLSALRPLHFPASSPLLVLLLHDLEKPFRYVEPKHPELSTKADRARFREEMIHRYGFRLDAAEQNALRYAEGEGDDYRPGERVMGELAAFVHSCDVLSARLWHDYPKPGADPWAKHPEEPALGDPDGS